VERLGDRLLIQPDKDASKLVFCSQRRKQCSVTIVVGDRVSFSDTESSVLMNVGANSSDSRQFGVQEGIVLEHHERRNLLERPTGRGNIRSMKPIAANIDQLMVVVAGSPQVPLPTIDSAIVAANKYSMRPVVVLNKIDSAESTAAFRERIQHLSALGIPILEVSAKTGRGIEGLRDALRGKCSIFVGQSGVGKSSLVNTLLPRSRSLCRRSRRKALERRRRPDDELGALVPCRCGPAGQQCVRQ